MRITKREVRKGQAFYYVMEVTGKENCHEIYHYAPTLKDARKLARRLKDEDICRTVWILRPIELFEIQ